MSCCQLLVCDCLQFAVIVGVVFLAEVILVVLLFLFEEDITDRIEKQLQEEGIERYRDDPDWHDFVNWVQEEVGVPRLR